MKKFFAILLLTASAYVSSQALDQFSNEDLKKLEIISPDIAKKLQTNQSDNSQLVTITDSIKSDNEGITEKKWQEEYFGYGFFNSEPNTNSPVLDIPLTSDYRLSVNDEVQVFLTGAEDRVINSRIDLSGNLNLPNIGTINLMGLTVSEADNLVSAYISQKLIGSVSKLSISRASLKKISVVGHVNSPGTFLVNPFLSVSEAIKYAGGFKEGSSLRNVEIISLNGTIKTTDFYKFLIEGKRDDDYSLRNGDTVIVSATDKFINIAGSVLRPLKYEYTSSDTYLELINFAQGFSQNADEASLQITYVNNSEISTRKVKLTDTVDPNLFDQFYIGSLPLMTNKNIFVEGSAVSSGYFDYIDGESFSQFLNKLKFSSEIYPFFAIYEYADQTGLKKNKTYFSLLDKSSMENIVLRKNSMITFFSFEQVLDKEVIVDADVKNIIFTLGNKTYDIPVTGQISPRSLHEYFGVAEGQDLIKDLVIVSKTEKIANSYDALIDSGNILSINIPSINSNLISVEISGEVKQPGTYKVNPNTNMQELYFIAGGLKETADERAIGLFRENIKNLQISSIESARKIIIEEIVASSANPLSETTSSIDLESYLMLSELYEPSGRLAGDFSNNSYLAENTILRNGDVIIVPTYVNEIVVAGEVKNQSAIAYQDGIELKDYIEMSGGFTENADRSGVYVIRVDGSSIQTTGNIFTYGDVEIKPGDTIIVPRDIGRFNLVASISVATRVLADLAFSAASLNAIK